MALTRFSIKWKRIIFPAVCLLLSGCGRFDWYSPPRPITTFGGTAIRAGTQASFSCEDEIITISSTTIYYFAEFIDEFGIQRQAMVSGLWVRLKDKPETNRYYSAYAGLSIYFYSIKIEILGVGADNIDKVTEVEVGTMKQSGGAERCSRY